MTAVAAPGSVREADRLPRLLRAVPSEPPYDTDSGDSTETAFGRVPASTLPLPFEPDLRSPGTRAALTLLTPAPTTPPTTPPRPVPGSESRVDAELRALFGARRTRREDLPDPRERAAAAIRILLEVLAGDRPARQVAAWVSPAILERLETHRIEPGRRRTRGHCLRSMHISEPRDAVAEVAAVVSDDASPSARRRAVALRLEGREGRWTVTALVVG